MSTPNDTTEPKPTESETGDTNLNQGQVSITDDTEAPAANPSKKFDGIAKWARQLPDTFPSGEQDPCDHFFLGTCVIKMIPVNHDFLIPPLMRRISESHAQKLAENIKLYGMKEPITVCFVTNGGQRERAHLVDGGHRCRAYQILGITHIRARVYTCDTDQRDMAISFLNLASSSYTLWEKTALIGSLEKTYKEVHPKYQRGGDRKNKNRQLATLKNDFVRFVQDQVDLTENQIERMLFINKHVNRSVGNKYLVGTPAEGNRSQLYALGQTAIKPDIPKALKNPESQEDQKKRDKLIQKAREQTRVLQTKICEAYAADPSKDLKFYCKQFTRTEADQKKIAEKAYKRAATKRHKDWFAEASTISGKDWKKRDEWRRQTYQRGGIADELGLLPLDIGGLDRDRDAHLFVKISDLQKDLYLAQGYVPEG